MCFLKNHPSEESGLIRSLRVQLLPLPRVQGRQILLPPPLPLLALETELGGEGIEVGFLGLGHG